MSKSISLLVQNWTTPEGIKKTYALFIDGIGYREFDSIKELNLEVCKLTN